MVRYHHTAWTPPSLPDSIVLLGGRNSAAKLTAAKFTAAQRTAEIVPGI